MPLHVSVSAGDVPIDLGLDFESKFTFICVFGFNSGLERKNPIGVIKSFMKAFPSTEPVQLILKTLNGNSRTEDFQSVQEAIERDERIVLIDGALSKQEVCGLINRSQAYVSLHRSEGFGRPIAEAMLLGVPVVATAWSGNADFLNPRTGFPVRYRLRKIAEGEYPWAAGEWAEPDLDHAAMLMRQLYEGAGARLALVKAAQKTVTDLFSRDEIGKKLRNRLVAIQEKQKFS
jgi:glycosyltransferase involved in cell wall biosynthesis